MKKKPTIRVDVVHHRVHCHTRLEQQRDALRRLLAQAQGAQATQTDNVLTFEKERTK